MEMLGYEFRDASLLEEALTTPSFRQSEPRARDNQRLEFLGDAVLGLIAAEGLYARRPDEREGSLSVRRTHMVSTAALSAAATRCGLAPRLRRYRGAGPLPENSKTLADAVEAVIGAAYLDGGLDAARRVFGTLALADNAKASEWSANPKGELQVRTQAMTPQRRPEYRLVRTEGSAHAPVFTVEVTVEGVGSATASAGTHKEAESRAAAALLADLL